MASGSKVEFGADLSRELAQEFRTMMKLYDEKKFRKALKVSDDILQKVPEHGETLSMRALIVMHIPDVSNTKKDCAARGLRSNLKSVMCWHSMGIIHKAELEFQDALKCFRMAWNLSPDNAQVVRDASLMAMHIRKYDVVASILGSSLKMQQPRFVWHCLAVAEFLRDNRKKEAVAMVERCISDHRTPQTPPSPSETSELYLFCTIAKHAAEGPGIALEYLEDSRENILDQRSFEELRARYLWELGRPAEAHSIYVSALLLRFPEDLDYLTLALATHADPRLREIVPVEPPRLAKIVRSDPESVEESWSRALEEVEEAPLVRVFRIDHDPRFGRSGKAWQVMPLAARRRREGMERVFCRKRLGWKREGDYTGLTTELLRKSVLFDEDTERAALGFVDDLRQQHPTSTMLTFAGVLLSRPKGPQLPERLGDLVRREVFRGVPSLFTTVKALLEDNDRTAVMLDIVSELSMSTDLEDNPQVRLFLTLLHAQMLDHLGKTEEALSQVEKAVGYSPAAPEVYLVKSRLLKHAGAYFRSWEAIDEARRLDLADRYVNIATSKALCRLGRVEEAHEIAKLFSEPTPQVASCNLVEMQAAWFGFSQAEGAVVRGELGLSLKRLSSVVEAMNDSRNDQYDFHYYAMRKQMFRPYISFIALNERLFYHQNYIKAATKMVHIYVELIRKGRTDPETTKEEVIEENNICNNAGEVPKDTKSKKRKHKNVKKDDHKPGTPVNNKAKIDADPKGTKFLEANFVEEARALVQTLRLECAISPTAWEAVFAFAYETEDLHLASEALNRLFFLEGCSIVGLSISPCLAQFMANENFNEALLESSVPLLDPIVDACKVVDTKTVASCSEAYLRRVSAELTGSLSNINARLRTINALKTMASSNAYKECLAASHEAIRQGEGTLLEATDLLSLVRSDDVHPTCMVAASVFPLADAFKDRLCLQQLS